MGTLGITRNLTDIEVDIYWGLYDLKGLAKHVRTCQGLKDKMGYPRDCGTWSGLPQDLGTNWDFQGITGIDGTCQDLSGIAGHNGTSWGLRDIMGPARD